MKTTILTSVFAVLVSVMNLSAKGITVYSNVESNESGVKKEYIRLDETTSTPLEKTSCLYDRNGNVLIRTFSIWKGKQGWINYGTYNYQYNEANLVANITYTKWDEKNAAWSEKTDTMIYIYDNNGQFLYVKHEKTGTNINHSSEFITLK